MSPVGDLRGEEYLCHVYSGGCSVINVRSWGWGRRGGSQPYMQWGCSVTNVPSGGWGERMICAIIDALGDTCYQRGVGKGRRISPML